MRYINWLMLFQIAQSGIRLAAKAVNIFNADDEAEEPLSDDIELSNAQRRSIAEDYINERVDMLVAKKRLQRDTAAEMKSFTPDVLESAYSLLKLERIDEGEEEKPDLSEVRTPLSESRPTKKRKSSRKK